MPIKPENRGRYPADWERIRSRILTRAGNRCEWCHVQNRDWGWRDDTGCFHVVAKRPLIDAIRRDREWVTPPFELGVKGGSVKVIEIVLTIAHMDHTPENCSDGNLRALCQRCHLAYDRVHHLMTAYMTRRESRQTMELPL